MFSRTRLSPTASECARKAEIQALASAWLCARRRNTRGESGMLISNVHAPRPGVLVITACRNAIVPLVRAPGLVLYSNSPF